MICNFPPTKSKVNALAHRIKLMRLPSTAEGALLSALRALYVIPDSVLNIQTKSYLIDVYRYLLEHYNISEQDLLSD